MSIASITNILQHDTTFKAALAAATEDTNFALLDGLRAPLLAAIYKRRIQQGKLGALLLVAATSREAEQLRLSLTALLPEAETVELPAWETLPHERLSPSRETVGKRMVALNKLRKHNGKTPLVVVASVRAILQAISPAAADAEALRLVNGVSVGGPNGFAETLVQLGYDRVDMVTKRGEFAVRGGIVDVFVPAAESAVRIDFFDDEVDDLRQFAVTDQRSAASIKHLDIWPARELLLTPDVRSRAGALRATMPQQSELLEKIAAGINAEGMESLLPYLVERQYALTELLPENSWVTVVSPEKVVARADSLAETNAEFLAAAWSAAAGEGSNTVPVMPDGDHSGMFTLTQVRAQGVHTVWHTMATFADSAQSVEATPLETSVGSDPAEHTAGLIKTWLQDNKYAVVVAGSTGAADRATEILLEFGLPVEKTPALPDDPQEKIVYVAIGEAVSGFASAGSGLLLATETELFGRQLSQQQMRGNKPLRRRGKNVVDPLQLKAGDYVVHERHGIGRFIELTQREIPADQPGEKPQKREYLVLEYAPSKRGLPADNLFVPTDQLGQLSRYVGAEAPKLSKMGGSDWASAKKKARKAVRDIAIQLAKLYAARSQAKGHAFSPDTPWQNELEEAFPYVETQDQMAAIEAVKRDMESSRPMDRLVSGDVGFGKTEIAVRAAFKAVQDNKQVVILVPTTLLVKQHFETFQNRFAGFPVRLKALSRFQTDKEAKQILSDLAAGSIDVVIGTHRLLSENVKYKDLGLVVIDEEQRFGVEHKDALKALKANVDVLAMSATPIPRTLEMAVTGIREMSTLATAPEDRHPILTFVGQFNEAQVAAAIRREMLREGQIFFVHNRVSSIHRIAKKIQDLVPEARVAVAHGRMAQNELEQVVVDFYERQYDVLVTTTIVETGLDIANANTIIIDGAEKYGLSQLHQLRGRVGRSRERAYAYFLYDPAKPLTEAAYERLDTIAQHNELGAGMQVALKDLELRGAGNLLGGEQSGHIAGVGFDLYLRMIGEAVDTFKGEDIKENVELVIEIPVDARIPDEFIDSERLRLEAYQKLAAAAHPNAAEGAIDLVLEELTDRYGAVPEQVAELVKVTRIRKTAAALGATKVLVLDGALRIEAVTLPESRQLRLVRLYPGAEYDDSRGRMTVPLPRGLQKGYVSQWDAPQLSPDEALDGDLVAWIARVFENIFAPPKSQTE
ncbi:transcription-repair coupling factor [Canibacter zhoujuaniae]|uniref:transcription-repair coupling factor n=1 Tax=Canibacter zhoujuaniae TaxID=2708343 RepID=UPI0014233C3D|nr:transcription-repair coupling factor [Canibacter zhoujuaniae]